MRLSATARYAVAGESGTWRYVGQATYAEEPHGREVDHDYVRMVEVGGDREVWVEPGDVTRVVTRRPAVRASA